MQTIWTRIVAVALVALCGATLASGCSANIPPDTLDGAKLEQNIQSDASKTQLKLAKVECPRDRVPKEGDHFSCAATVDGGGSLVYDVAITSDRGEYTYQLAPGQVIDGAEAARVLQADIVAAGPAVADAVVTCPPSIVAPGTRTVFDCTLRAAGGTTQITVTSERDKPLVWKYKTR